MHGAGLRTLVAVFLDKANLGSDLQSVKGAI